MVRAGDMRHQVRIERQATNQDAAGQPQRSWTLVAERRAAIQRTPGNEIFASAQRQGRVPVVFRLRYLSGVLPSMRLVFDGRTHNILSASDPDGRHEELVITAEELVEVTP